MRTAVLVIVLVVLPSVADTRIQKTPGLSELSTSLQNLAQKVSPWTSRRP